VNGKIGVFCPTLNVYGGGEYVAIAIANTLAANNRDVLLFSSGEINPQAIKNYFGETLHPKIQTLRQPTNFTPRGLADFYQTILHSYIAKSKCTHFIDAFSNCVFPWTQVSYIHFPYLNQYVFSRNFPYLSSPRLNQAGTLPHVLLEKNLVDYKKHLVLANSRFTAGEIQKYSAKSAAVLYPPFSACIQEIGKTTTKNLQSNLVVTVSRLDSNKLLERIPYIAAQTDKGIEFAVVGRLCSQAILDQLNTLVKTVGVADRVKFYPNAPAAVKIDLLRRAKIYLHTMVGEHFGISIVEAMALGCVPIVHNSGGMTEFVPAKYRYESIDQAAEKITQELSNWSQDDAEAMKEIASQFSTQKFSERFIHLFDSFYERA
jgi:glycosyltransferase involved in cell wall biosynthesis